VAGQDFGDLPVGQTDRRRQESQCWQANKVFAPAISGDCLAFVDRIIENRQIISAASSAVEDWLKHEWGLKRIGPKFFKIGPFDADSFVEAVRGELPKKRKFTSAEISELKREYSKTIEPARVAKYEILKHEYQLSSIVNESYGLSPEEVKLIWETAPPRMPFVPPGFVSSHSEEPGIEIVED
jgi:hypothetical protein